MDTPFINLRLSRTLKSSAFHETKANREKPVDSTLAEQLVLSFSTPSEGKTMFMQFKKRLMTMAGKKTAAKKSKVKSASKKSTKSNNANYTNPELREKVRKRVMAGSKGGRAGQWSARKAQLLAHEYVALGGGYKRPRSAAQKSLKQWGDERWHTADGKQAIQGDTTHRYLPDKAWKKLPPQERRATDRKKVAGSKRGKQFVANTPAAAKARKRATLRKG